MNLAPPKDFESVFGPDYGEPENPRAKIGGNNAPDAIERSKDTLADISEFIKEEPVISSEEMARRAKSLIDRAKASLEEMDAERDGKVRPLNERVRAINAEYKSPISVLRSALDVARARLNAFINAERERKEAEARAAEEEAERKIKEAQEAQARLAESADNAAQGEIGVDVIQATAEAERKAAEAQKAIRAAMRADKETNVRIGGGFGRVLTQRSKETLVLTDRIKALTVMEFPANVDEALLTAARNYRKLKGKLPEGVVAETEKSL